MYQPDDSRYERMEYRRCGSSGLMLPIISLGLWQNFSADNDYCVMKEMILGAFDRGITHMDLANNYGMPKPGSAEVHFGRILNEELKPYRDELVIATKAGYTMWPGPYGDWGSRKYLISSIDQSLKRMGIDYVDIFYHHRPDLSTPLEETMGALADIVRQGKALYVGISNYDAGRTREAIKILRNSNTPCLIHQPRYNMFDRWIEDGLLETLGAEGVGCMCFSPLAQGALTGKYLGGIPAGSRASKGGTIKDRYLSDEHLAKITRLNALAEQRGQSLSQMALMWVLRRPEVTSVLIGASSLAQIEENTAIINQHSFSEGELAEIEAILSIENMR